MQIITENICTFIKTNVLKISKQIRTINNQQIIEDYYQQIRYQFFLDNNAQISLEKCKIHRSKEKNLAIVKHLYRANEEEERTKNEKREILLGAR